MSYIDTVMLIRTEGVFEDKDFGNTLVTEEYIKKFKKIMSISGEHTNRFRNTEDSSQFIEWCPAFKVLPEEMLEDLFYVEKNGYFIKGVPAKLIFIITKAMKVYPPNKAISVIDKRLLKRYEQGKNLAKGVSIHQIMNTIKTTNVNILTKEMPIVLNSGVYEVYLEKEDEILLLPESVGAGLYANPYQIRDLVVDSAKGVVLAGVPLISLLNGKEYVDMFDLRDVL